MNACCNYIQFSDFAPFSYHMAYVDVPEYYADEIFNNHKLRIDYGKEMYHPDHGYRVIFCKIRKWDKNKFVKCMYELKDKMLICGRGDYPEYCEHVFDAMISDK